MSSSSRHLIHPELGLQAAQPPEAVVAPALRAAPTGPAPALVAPAGSQSAGSSVLRGRGHGPAMHPALGHTSLGQVQGGLPAALASVGIDPADFEAQLRRLEAEAESRGYESGHARAEGELRAAVASAGALAQRMQETAPDRTSDIAHSIAELALSVARRILQHEVRTDPTVLCGALEAAVGTINGSPEARVMLNPAAVDSVRAAWEALHGRAYLGKRWTFEGDPTLPAGGCTLRYEHGFVEAGLESQLEEIGIALDRAIPNLSRTSLDEDVA